MYPRQIQYTILDKDVKSLLILSSFQQDNKELMVAIISILRIASYHLKENRSLNFYYPTALKVLSGYCFHPWCPDGRAGGGK